MRSADEAVTRAAVAALPDVAGEVVTDLPNFDIEQVRQPLLDLQCSIAADHVNQ